MLILFYIEQRSLAINILFIKREAMIQKQIKAFLLSLSADIKKDSLLVIVFEMRVGAVVQKQFHNFVWLLMINEDGRNIKSGLPGLSFESIDDGWSILFEVSMDFVHCTTNDINELPALDSDDKVVDGVVRDVGSLGHCLWFSRQSNRYLIITKFATFNIEIWSFRL